MAFGGGGGGQITNHVHDNTPLQGGPLDMAGTTIGSLNQGSITYSDGAALQELISPAVPAGEVLTFAPAATAPSWSAGGGGGSYNFKEAFTLGADNTTFEWIFTNPYVYNDFEELQIRFNCGVTGVAGSGMGLALQMGFNGSGGAYETTNYLYSAFYNSGPAQGYNNDIGLGNPAMKILASNADIGAGIHAGNTLQGVLRFTDSPLIDSDGGWIRQCNYDITNQSRNQQQIGRGWYRDPTDPESYYAELERVKLIFLDGTTTAIEFEAGSQAYCYTIASS